MEKGDQLTRSMKCFVTTIRVLTVCVAIPGSTVVAQTIDGSELPSKESFHLFLPVGQLDMTDEDRKVHLRTAEEHLPSKGHRLG